MSHIVNDTLINTLVEEIWSLEARISALEGMKGYPQDDCPRVTQNDVDDARETLDKLNHRLLVWPDEEGDVL